MEVFCSDYTLFFFFPHLLHWPCAFPLFQMVSSHSSYLQCSTDCHNYAIEDNRRLSKITHSMECSWGVINCLMKSWLLPLAQFLFISVICFQWYVFPLTWEFSVAVGCFTVYKYLRFVFNIVRARLEFIFITIKNVSNTIYT